MYPKAKSSNLLPPKIVAMLLSARNQAKVVVLATGVFDLLHSEHALFLERAKEAGGFLIVGLESDARVRALKGDSRPVENEAIRYENVAALSFVDCAFVLPDDFVNRDDHRNLIATIRPNILAVSSHSPFIEKKQQIMSEFGGSVKVVHQHNPQVSTTEILKKSAT